jgi:hypothetical protein
MQNDLDAHEAPSSALAVGLGFVLASTRKETLGAVCPFAHAAGACTAPSTIELATTATSSAAIRGRWFVLTDELENSAASVLR